MLPTKGDFCPWGEDDLDAAHAWRNFGGLTLAEAHSKFRENTLCYQEDFMFMGGKAFAFYFPVLEDYLRESALLEGEDGDHEAWIIAKGIESQWVSTTAPHVAPLGDRIISLARSIQDNISQFGDDEEERTRVLSAWRELEAQIRSSGNGGEAD